MHRNLVSKIEQEQEQEQMKQLWGVGKARWAEAVESVEQKTRWS